MRQLFSGIDILKVSGNLDIPISGIRYDSRKVGPGDVFVCIKGFKSDGHEYIQEAIANGATAIVVEQDIPIGNGITKILVDNTRKALGTLACNFYEDPSSRLFLAGITGTNGKTTTAFLARAVLSKVCKNVVLMGTIANMVGEDYFPAERTTAESLDTIAFLNTALSRSAEAAVMEVSSHAASLERLSGLEFDCGVFTNLTRDHLDFHNTLDEYLNAKGRFFSMLGEAGRKEAIAFVNADDPGSDRIASFVKCARLVTYGIQDLLDGKRVRLRATGYGTDCYPLKELETSVSLDELNEAYLFDPRNVYQNYGVATNSSSRTIYTYMGTLLPKFRNATYSTSGELSPLLNDPFYRTVGIGTRIFLGGGVGYVAWSGTQHSPSKERLENGVPVSSAATLALIGDLKGMSTEFIRAAIFHKYGVTMFVGVGIPIPILDEDMVRFVSVRNRDIYTTIFDYGVQKRDKPTYGRVNYEQLRSGVIDIHGKRVPTAPLSSLHKARQIAQTLKTWIQKGAFLLQEPVQNLPDVGVAKPLNIVNEEGI